MAGPTGALTHAGARIDPSTTKIHLVGGGIASLAAAAFLIRDGGHPRPQYHRLRGTRDDRRQPRRLRLRQGRLGPARWADVREQVRLHLRAVRLHPDTGCHPDGDRRDPAVEQDAQDVVQGAAGPGRQTPDGTRVRTHRAAHPDDRAAGARAGNHAQPDEHRGPVDAGFFKTDFWFTWCTTFAFQPWHSAAEFRRYLVRFAHMVAGFERLEGIMRTPYNQFGSLVRPLRAWLDARGVRFETETRVTDLDLVTRDGDVAVTRIVCERLGQAGEVAAGADDLVLVTLGSRTEASSLGAMDRAPVLGGKADGGAWPLWERLARDRPAFGRPSVFSDRVDQSKWVSFTTTLHDPTLLRFVQDLTGNVPGEGGLITFPDSGWLASIVIPYQPHFLDQPDDVAVFWGYGLSFDHPGDFMTKPMSACTRVALTVIVQHGTEENQGLRCSENPHG